MRYIKIKMDIDDENYYIVHRAIKEMLNKLESPEIFKIRHWKFIE